MMGILKHTAYVAAKVIYSVNAIVWGTWGLLKDQVNLSLDAPPEGIDICKVVFP